MKAWRVAAFGVLFAVVVAAAVVPFFRYGALEKKPRQLEAQIERVDTEGGVAEVGSSEEIEADPFDDGPVEGHVPTNLQREGVQATHVQDQLRKTHSG